MTTIFDAPEDFAATALQGFAALYGRYVRLVRNGVVRSTRTPEGKVAVVVGGGSGHYPAFAGYVGPGLADAAVAGDVFASPSTAAVARVCRAAHRGGGVLLGFGNYAGDVLNFGVAADELRAEGMDVRIVHVTDDVASAPRETPEKRRGIAGDLVVFKIAGAAAEAGHALDAVERVARHANSRTVTVGVAFGGCTLPGAREPLFTVQKGRMAVGLGIHGEPGVAESEALPAADLARLLTDRLLEERPAGVTRVGALLNGLGATKYEELFVLWTRIAERLSAAGLTVVAPEAGEFVTSLDMSGCSLTLLWLDEELESLWTAPCDTPVLRRGAAPQALEAAGSEDMSGEEGGNAGFARAPEAGRWGAACIAGTFEAMAALLREKEAELGRIDAQAGDGDHGQGMARGSAAALLAARTAAEAGAGTATTLRAAAEAWADRAGGTSGALWGVLLKAFAAELSDDAEPAGEAVVKGARAALDAVMRAGGAKVGDKTLVDAFVPFVDVLDARFAATGSLKIAWTEAAEVAGQAAEATAPLSPKLGRARPLAERSIGHPDAGAVSLAMIATVIGARLS